LRATSRNWHQVDPGRKVAAGLEGADVNLATAVATPMWMVVSRRRLRSLAMMAGRNRPLDLLERTTTVLPGNQAEKKSVQKSYEKSMVWFCRVITIACYLCNTLAKTRCSTAFKAVPLLLV